MDKKPLTDWLYRWIGEIEARPNSLYWFVDRDIHTYRRLVVLFPFCLIASSWGLCRNAKLWLENTLYIKGRRNNRIV